MITLISIPESKVLIASLLSIWAKSVNSVYGDSSLAIIKTRFFVSADMLCVNIILLPEKWKKTKIVCKITKILNSNRTLHVPGPKIVVWLFLKK